MSSIKKKVIDAFRRIEDFRNHKKDPNINQIFFKKFKVLNLISVSKFSSIYEGININTKEKVAIKLEEINKYNLLENEAYTIFSIKGFGIIDLISFGKNKKYYIMIQPFLGDSLSKLFLSKNKNFNIVDICLIAIQCLERIEWIHKNNIIHRDIKPDNFLFGIKDPRIIYLIDFGLSKKYRSKRTFKHIKYSYTKKIIGTARYTSTNSLRGFEMSRRDDLESFCYMIIYFVLKKLPWQDIKATTRVEKYQKILQLKTMFDIEDYKFVLPNEIIKIFKYVKHLKFEEEPNYLIIKNSFKSILYKYGRTEDEVFSWIKDEHILNSKVSPNFTLRKSSLKKRIFDNIQRYQKDEYLNNNLPKKNISNITEISPNYTPMNTFNQIKKSKYNILTFPSKDSMFKNINFSSTPENRTMSSFKAINKTINIKPKKINNGVLKYLKIGKANMLKYKKINIRTKIDNEKAKKEIFNIGLKRDKHKIKNKIYFNAYKNSENSQIIENDYIINKNNSNNFVNNRDFIYLNENEDIKRSRYNKTNFLNEMNIPNKLFVNSISSRNKVNKLLFLKNKGVLNETPKFIINNTFINNFNNRNIININKGRNLLNNNMNNIDLFESLRNQKY